MSRLLVVAVVDKRNAASNTAPHRNLLYIKIPKTGSSTLQRVLYTASVKCFNFTLPHIDPQLGEQIDTCHEHTSALENWNAFVQSNGGALDVFALHACFKEDMMRKEYWKSGKKPFLLTMMRNPFEQFASSYRYIQYCCNETKLTWCRHICAYVDGKDMSKFIRFYCQNGYCNQQSLYMGEGRYDLVMILERFDDSLALLGVKLHLPSWALFYVAENANVFVNKSSSALLQLSSSGEARAEFEAVHLAEDWRRYRNAQRALDMAISSLTVHERWQFHALRREIALGNARLASSCNTAAQFDGFSFTWEMLQCWKRELRAMALENGWGAAPMLDHIHFLPPPRAH